MAKYWTAHSGTDFCTEAGAKQLAAIIRTYWAERGFVVDVFAISGNIRSLAGRDADPRADVRSNLINGRPHS